MLTEKDYHKIIARRDPRWDGRFYFGVKTTRIYCRPVCPARPKPENIVIFRSAGEAERAGYRACLRCRPDFAPGNKTLFGTAGSVARAMRLIDSWTGDDLNVEALASSLGMTARHLRRLFDEHLGASPVEIIATRRLHFARQLLTQTNRPVAEIAAASGFRSVRRFNEAFKASFRRRPTDVRRGVRVAGSAETLRLRIPVRPPFDWKNTLAYLKRHETGGLERVDADSYTRYVPHGRAFARVRVTFDAKSPSLIVDSRGFALTDLRPVLLRLKSVFDADHNPAGLPKSAKGIRVPGGFDAFETAVAIVLGQLISTAQAKAKMDALVARFGRPAGADEDGFAVVGFPAPSVLRDAPVEEIGIPRMKARAIRALARLAERGGLPLLPGADPGEARRLLLSIDGIGPWTAEMIAMRCLGDSDAFPSGDLVVRRALDAKIADEAAWSSSRAYLTHVLWRDHSKIPARRKGRKR